VLFVWLLVFDLGFVDEHYRNVIANGIHALALDAFQSAPVRLHFYCRPTRWTDQNIEQFFTDGHGLNLTQENRIKNGERLL
jgi:hypothetical protein